MKVTHTRKPKVVRSNDITITLSLAEAKVLGRVAEAMVEPKILVTLSKVAQPPVENALFPLTNVAAASKLLATLVRDMATPVRAAEASAKEMEQE